MIRSSDEARGAARGAGDAATPAAERGKPTKPITAEAPRATNATVSWSPDDTAPQTDGLLAAPLRRIAQFILLDHLGAGGMGVVYAAYDEKLERKVAIKLVATSSSSHGAHARLLREAQAQARLSHPNVVTVYEVGTLLEGGLFIAMELVKGTTLRAWQRAPGRTWRELVDMYAAAGAGLAAAHRGGIVHRDFKPDNVLVGDDGRARVADFGLAFASEEHTPPSEPGGASGAPSRSGPRAPLTEVGALVGTPGYMAPEQSVGVGGATGSTTGSTVDARTDQFAFCVALYEALHGERPFADLAFRGGAKPAPRRASPDPRYPRPLWDVVMRGLALDPARRFPSMDALLVELARSRDGARRRLAVGGVVLGVAAVAGVAALALTRTSEPPCPRPVAELAGVWDPATKLRVQAAMRTADAPFAAPVWASTEAALDRYAGRWLAAQQAACEATHVRHVQSASLLDQRTECLAGRRRTLAAAVEVLETQPARAAAHASDLLGSLGDLEPCADTSALLAQTPASPTTPAGLARQGQRSEARRQLARATAILLAGDLATAATILAGVDRLAGQLDDGQLTAELRLAEGHLQISRGDLASGIRTLQQAAELAVDSRHDELQPDIWLTLVTSAGSWEHRPAEVGPWLGQAEAWLRRSRRASDGRVIAAERARAQLQMSSGKARDAEATLSRAIPAAEALWGTTDPQLVPLLRARAAARARLGQASAAQRDAERALAVGLAAWGPAHPELASLRRVLGLIYVEQLGDVARGERELTLALRYYQANVGADSIDVAHCEQALSQAGQYRGDYAAALAHAERAEQIYALRLGPDHPRRGEALNGLGVLRFMRRDYAGSLAAYVGAERILTKALGARHATIGLLHSNTGETLLALGRPDAAEASFRQALEVMSAGLGQDHADLALPLKGIGIAALQRGRAAEAIAPLERALTLRTATSSASDPQELAEVRWTLARALRALAQAPARSRELAEAALAAYRTLGPESKPRAAEIERWLAARAP